MQCHCGVAVQELLCLMVCGTAECEGVEAEAGGG